MRIKVKNLGVLRQAEFELGDLTIICGENNTGKTYATYALYGFLSFWRDVFYLPIPDNSIQQLLNKGTAVINIEDYIGKAQEFLDQGCKGFTAQLPRVFSSKEKYFADTEFRIELDANELRPSPSFERTMGTAKRRLFSITKKQDSPHVVISLLVEKEKAEIPVEMIRHIIGDSLKDILFGHLFPRTFIDSAERTGAAIFYKELDFARNRLLESMSSKKKNIDPFELLRNVYSDYALPVKKNVDFVRRLDDVAKRESFISKEQPKLLEDFTKMVGGKYFVTSNGEIYFVPKGEKIKLTMDECSSSVRSLLDFNFYLRHEMNKSDLLIMDEPELNLHPENQRRMARLFARLVNLGIKVFITTHSDYLIKELNTLIMLNHDKPYLKEIAKKEGYKPEELLAADKVRVYIAEEAPIKLEGGQRKTRCQTLTPANIDPELGIEAPSFETTIDEMIRIQEEIMFSVEDA